MKQLNLLKGDIYLSLLTLGSTAPAGRSALPKVSPTLVSRKPQNTPCPHAAPPQAAPLSVGTCRPAWSLATRLFLPRQGRAFLHHRQGAACRSTIRPRASGCLTPRGARRRQTTAGRRGARSRNRASQLLLLTQGLLGAGGAKVSSGLSHRSLRKGIIASATQPSARIF